MPIPDHLRESDQSIYEFKWSGEIPTRKAIGPKHESMVSRITGCMIMTRPRDGDDPLITINASGLVELDLVGYAVIPIEEWNKMVSMAEKYSQIETYKLLERVRKPDARESIFSKIKRYVKQILHIGK
jgi:hypothetical protein